MKVPWQRLIRFESADGRILYGEPILPSPDFDVGEVTEKDVLKAKVIEGTDLFDTSGKIKVSDETVIVKKLLGPLAQTDVPIVRCIGLNYAKHSMWIFYMWVTMIEISVNSGISSRNSQYRQESLSLIFSCGSLLTDSILLVREAGRTPPPFPSLFFKPSTSIHDHNAPIIIPKIAQDDQADYEGELVGTMPTKAPSSDFSVVSRHWQRCQKCVQILSARLCGRIHLRQ